MIDFKFYMNKDQAMCVSKISSNQSSSPPLERGGKMFRDLNRAFSLIMVDLKIPNNSMSTTSIGVLTRGYHTSWTNGLTNHRKTTLPLAVKHSEETIYVASWSNWKQTAHQWGWSQPLHLSLVKPDTKHFDKVNARVSVVTLFDLSKLVVY